jgi:hypothetical protein
LLNSHDTNKVGVYFGTPEFNAGRHFSGQISRGHIRFVPAVGWDCAVIPLSGHINDMQ